MNGYIYIYNRKHVEVYADSSYDAQRKAAIEFKLKAIHAYKVTVMLSIDRNGEQVTHSIGSI